MGKIINMIEVHKKKLLCHQPFLKYTIPHQTLNTLKRENKQKQDSEELNNNIAFISSLS